MCWCVYPQCSYCLPAAKHFETLRLSGTAVLCVCISHNCGCTRDYASTASSAAFPGVQVAVNISIVLEQYRIYAACMHGVAALMILLPPHAQCAALAFRQCLHKQCAVVLSAAVV